MNLINAMENIEPAAMTGLKLYTYIIIPEFKTLFPTCVSQQQAFVSASYNNRA